MKKKGLPTVFNSICVMVVVLSLMVFMPSGAKAQKPIKLKYATHATDRHRQYSEGALIWLKNIEDATGGRVKITPYPSQTLCKGRDTFEAVKGGIADIGMAFVGLFPGRFPITEVPFLPCMCMGPACTAESCTRVVMEAYQKFPEMQAEYADVKFLFLYTMQPCFVATRKKAVHKLEDLKGLKLRIAGTYITDFMKAQGAVPMLMPPGAMYENMQKRVIDGYAYSWDGFLSRKMYEVTDFVTNAKWYSGAFFVVMNLDKWNSLPPDIQKAMMSVTGVQSAVHIAKQFDHETQPAIEKCKTVGVEVINLAPAEQERWKQAAKPIWDIWLKKVEAKGVPHKRAQEILDETLNIYAKYAKK